MERVTNFQVRIVPIKLKAVLPESNAKAGTELPELSTALAVTSTEDPDAVAAELQKLPMRGSTWLLNNWTASK